MAAAATNSDKIDDHNTRLTRLEAQAQATNDRLLHIANTLDKIFVKLDGLTEAFARQPISCMRDVATCLEIERNHTDARFNNLKNRIWAAASIVVAIPTSIVGLVWLLHALTGHSIPAP